MNSPRTLYRRFALSAATLTTIMVLLRAPALCLFFDREVGYYDANAFSTLLYICLALLAIGCAAYATWAARFQKRHLLACAPDVQAATPIVCCSSWLVVAAFLPAIVWEIMTYQATDFPALLRMAGALIAIVYFILPNKQQTMAAGLGVHLYCVFCLVFEYYDWTVPMNSPLKLMQQAAILAVMLFLTVELNHLNGTHRPIRYTICAALAMTLAIPNALSLIVAAAVGGIVKTEYLIRSLPVMAVGLYAAARLFNDRAIEIKQEETSSKQHASQSSEEISDESSVSDIGIDAQETPAIPTTSDKENESHG